MGIVKVANWSMHVLITPSMPTWLLLIPRFPREEEREIGCGMQSKQIQSVRSIGIERWFVVQGQYRESRRGMRLSRARV
jgi:hypothetical protein